MDRLERQIQDDILKLCQRPWVKLWRTGSDRRKSNSLPIGWPDITGIKRVDGRGIFVFIEVKRPGKNPTPEQLTFLRAAIGMGGIAGVARSLEDAMEILGLR